MFFIFALKKNCLTTKCLLSSSVTSSGSMAVKKKTQALRPSLFINGKAPSHVMDSGRRSPCALSKEERGFFLISYFSNSVAEQNILLQKLNYRHQSRDSLTEEEENNRHSFFSLSTQTASFFLPGASDVCLLVC